MHAATICRTCKHRPAQEGGCGVPLCSACHVEADAFMARFTQNDSIDAYAGVIGTGMISFGAGIAMTLIGIWLIGGWPL